MASHQPKDVNGFVGQREQARYPAATLPQPGPHGSSQYPPQYTSTKASQPQSLEVSPGTDLASRRQKTMSNRRDIGEKLRVVRPPTLSNPDELPLRKRSAMTLIERAQGATQAAAGEDIVALASKISSFQPFTKAPRTTFDDTESIMTTDTEYFAGDENYNQYQVTLATDYNKRNPASNPNLKLVSSEHANMMRGQLLHEEEYQDCNPAEQARARGTLFFGPELKDLADKERKLFDAACQGQSTGTTVGYDLYAGSTQDENPADAESDYYNNNSGEIGSPDEWPVPRNGGVRAGFQPDFSAGHHQRTVQADFGPVGAQEHLTKGRAGNTDVVDFAAQEVPVWNTKKQIGERTDPKAVTMPTKLAPTTKEVDKGKQAVRKTDVTIPTRSAGPSTVHLNTKATSFGGSSPSPTFEQEYNSSWDAGAAAHKRSHEDSFDYAREQLANMSYNELDSKPFLADPEDPSHEPARVLKGTEPTLESRLSNMTGMTEDQCRTMFAAMTDAENEGTGQWFVADLQEKMEQLMLAKHKRRMIALKYEHEIKMRNAMVNAKTKDVDDELNGLKSGLGNLMPTSKKDRREAAKTGKKVAKKAGGSDVA